MSDQPEQPLTLPWQRFNDTERKKRFARELHARPKTLEGRYEAALRAFPDPGDEVLAIKARDEWIYDRTVIDELDRLNKEDMPEDLPTRAQQARDIYNLAQDPSKAVDDRLKAHKLYAEVMGFIQKPLPGAGGGNTFIDNRRVIMMPAPPASIEDWEAEAIEHQAKLVSDAAS